MVGACTEVREEPAVSLCERYAEAAERVVLGWSEEADLAYQRAREEAPPQVPAVGGPNALMFYAAYPLRVSALFFAPTVESRCSWRELNLVVEFREIAEYFDPEILLGSILDDLRGKEGMDAYADRMKIVVEDFDTGFYAAFDPRD